MRDICHYTFVKTHRMCPLKRCTTWELWIKFYLGQKEDFRPGASQIALRDCSKVAVGESQYWWRGSSILWSTHFTKGFLLIMRIWCHHEGIYLVLLWMWGDARTEIIKSVPKNIQLSKDQSHQILWSTECLPPPWTLSGGVEGLQL